VLRVTKHRGVRRTPCHRPVRAWRTPWRRRCTCGTDSLPCPGVASSRPLATQLSAPLDAAGDAKYALRWNAPTAPFTTLPTPAQRWRGNGGRWRQS